MPELEPGAATYFTYRESNQVFEDIAVWDRREVSITGHGEPERAQALWVTDGCSRCCGCSRCSAESSPKRTMLRQPRRAVLTHGYWQRDSAAHEMSSVAR